MIMKWYPQSERLTLLVDGQNTYAAARALGFDIDYSRLREYFEKQGILVRPFFATSLVDDGYSAIKTLVDFLDYNGWTILTKVVKNYGDGSRKTKGNGDVDIAVRAMELAPHVDHIVLFSGDGVLTVLVEALKRMGKRVTVVSTVCSSPSMVADSLRRAADQFVDLQQLQPHIARDPQDCKRREEHHNPSVETEDDVDDVEEEKSELTSVSFLKR